MHANEDVKVEDKIKDYNLLQNLYVPCQLQLLDIKFYNFKWCSSRSIKLTQPHLYVVRGGGGKGLDKPWRIDFPLWIIATRVGGATPLSIPERITDVDRGKVRNSRIPANFKFGITLPMKLGTVGGVIAYQNTVPIAFHYQSRGIDADYVYGVSLTNGQNPREHIWTFAGASAR